MYELSKTQKVAVVLAGAWDMARNGLGTALWEGVKTDLIATRDLFSSFKGATIEPVESGMTDNISEVTVILPNGQEYKRYDNVCLFGTKSGFARVTGNDYQPVDPLVFNAVNIPTLLGAIPTALLGMRMKSAINKAHETWTAERIEQGAETGQRFKPSKFVVV